MFATPIYALMTYGLAHLFGRKQTKYVNHLLFWLGFWALGWLVTYCIAATY